jgi:hypothetical protein
MDISIWWVLFWAASIIWMYVHAGRKTWQVIFLTMPERSDEPLLNMVRSNSVPWYVYCLWSVFWGPIMMVAFGAGRIVALRGGIMPSWLNIR